MSVRSLLILLAVVASAHAPAGAQSASFQGLGDLSGGSFASRAYGVSADGNVVVGEANSSEGAVAFRWTASGGMAALGDLPGGSPLSIARAASADGSVVVGTGSSENGTEAFRWTAAGGMQGLGDLPTGGFFSQGFGVSADGSVVTGYASIAGAFGGSNEAFRWTSAGGMQGLGSLPGGDFSLGLGISADGAVVVGQSESGTTSGEAFRWTSGGGMVGIGFLSGGTSSTAFAANAAGNTVVGSSSGSAEEAFLWTAAGMIPLGLAGSTATYAAAVSGDGTVVVGRITGFPLNRAFIWTASTGMEHLQDVLVQQGVDMTGWTLAEATGISADGRVVVGFGVNPQGQMEAWRAVLPRLVLVNPLPGALVVGGEWFRIRWNAPSSIGAVALTLLPDTLGTAPRLISSGLAGSDTSYAWSVPDSLYSRSARLVLRGITDSTVADTSDYFRIKPYHLTRLTAGGGRYVPFHVAHHGWQHANTSANWFPPAWYAQFNYRTGADPFTGFGYDDDFTAPPINAAPAVFPDWPAYVRAFGTGAAYHLIAGPLSQYRDSFTAAWGAFHGTEGHGGSCYGLATTSLLAFSYRPAFGARYPNVGAVDRLFAVALGGPAREVANEQYVHQGGLLAQTAQSTRLGDGPRVALAMLKTAFAADSTSSVLGVLTLKNVTSCAPVTSSGGHAVTPYRLQRDRSGAGCTSASGCWRAYIYDSNWPADSTRFVVVDSTANTWSYAGGLNWGGGCGMFVRDPIANYLQLALVDPFGLAAPTLRDGGTGLYVAAEPGANIRLASADGAIGYANGAAFNTLPGAFANVPDVGGPAPPTGYEVPPAAYELRMAAFPDSAAAMYVFGNGAIYAYGRADADTTHTDRLSFDPAAGIGGGLTVASADVGVTKTVTLRAILHGDAEPERTLDAADLPLAGADSVAFTALADAAGPRLRLTNRGGAKTYTLQLRQADAAGSARFRHVNVPLVAGATHTARPDWATLGMTTVEVDVDLDGDGVPDDVLVLENQPVANTPGPAPGGTPSVMVLHAPAPNPTSGATTLQYELPDAGTVRLVLYDALGREVAVLVDGDRTAGTHDVTLEAGRLAAGVYVALLESGGAVDTRRVIVVR